MEDFQLMAAARGQGDTSWKPSINVAPEALTKLYVAGEPMTLEASVALIDDMGSAGLVAHYKVSRPPVKEPTCACHLPNTATATGAHPWWGGDTP
jgi:hypothetical protein